MKIVTFILSLVSIIGAILNGYGLSICNINLALVGQLVWVSSNSGWVCFTLIEKRYSEMAMFTAFLCAAIFSVYASIIRM